MQVVEGWFWYRVSGTEYRVLTATRQLLLPLPTATAYCQLPLNPAA